MTIDFDSIRARNPLGAYLDRIAWIGRRSGSNLIGKCPIHREVNGASFSVNPDLGKWTCFGKCGRSGDVIDLEQELGGGTFAQAAERLVGGELPRIDLVSRGAIQTPNKPVPYTMNRDELTRMAESAHRLARNPSLLYEAIGPRPELSEEAIRGSALEGDLGFENGWLLFGYTNGIKARQNRAAERFFKWLCGSAGNQCWRQSLMLKSHKTVLITEGETDAIRLLSAGAEIPGKIVISALASASTLPDPQPFSGKHVIYFPDDDEAGRRAQAKLRSVLTGYAKTFTALPLEGFIRE